MSKPKVKALWASRKLLAPEVERDIYLYCEPKIGTRCINTRAAKAMAEATGRSVRKVNTLDGYMNWSECLDGQWHMFRAPLTLKYAQAIDRYDNTGRKFRLPVAAPFGAVEYKGPSVERRDPIPVIRERKKRHNARVASGAHKPRSKFRRAQAPAVAAREARHAD